LDCSATEEEEEEEEEKEEDVLHCVANLFALEDTWFSNSRPCVFQST
jgi:hypothetical protein